MKEKYTIREAAQILGMSSEALRYYEREKLITPLRDRGSGYRVYDKFAMLRLGNCKRLRSMQFSLREANEALKGGAPAAFADQLERKRGEIGGQIAWLQAIDRHMARYVATLRDIPQRINTFEVATSPEIYFILHHHDKHFFVEDALASVYPVWSAKMPLVRLFSITPLQSALDAQPLVRLGGLAITRGDAALTDLVVEGAAVKHCPAQRCVYTIIKIENTPDSLHSRFAPALRFMAESGYQLAGDPWAFQLFANYTDRPSSQPEGMEGETGTVYYEYYLPIKEIDQEA